MWFFVLAFGVIDALNTPNVAEDIVNMLFIAVVGTIGASIANAAGVDGIERLRSFC